MKVPKLFKLDCFKLKLFTLLFFTSFNLQATQYDIEIRRVKGAKQMEFLRPSGKIYKKHVAKFIELPNVHGNTKNWDNFAGELASSDRKGKIGEIAALIYFQSLGYEPIYYKVKTVGNQGIDAIFVKRDELRNPNPSHMIINEAKFNKAGFKYYNIGRDKVRQSHSKWNLDRFRTAGIPCVRYAPSKIIRTATYLKYDGTLHLYEIKDKVGGGYPSDYRLGSAIRTAWDLLVP